MEQVQQFSSKLINFLLVAVLGASWLAFRFPELSVAITAFVVLISTGVAVVIPLLMRRFSSLSTDELVIENAATATVDVSSVFTTQDLKGSGREAEAWQNLLKQWDGPHRHDFENEMFYKVLRRTLNDRLDIQNPKDSINIGIVNLVISSESASIKLHEQYSKPDRKQDHKVDVILRPEIGIDMVRGTTSDQSL